LGYTDIIKNCHFDQVVVVGNYKYKCPKQDKKFKWVVDIPAFSVNNKPYEFKVDAEWIAEYGQYNEYGKDIYVLSLEEYLQVEYYNDLFGSEEEDDHPRSQGGTTQANKKRTRGVTTRVRKRKAPIVEENESNSEEEDDGNDILGNFDEDAMSDGEDVHPDDEENPPQLDAFYRQESDFEVKGHTFERNAQGASTEARFKDKTPLAIVLDLFEPIMKLLCSANKNKRRLFLSTEECFTYHAFMVYMSIIKLNSIKDYWENDHPLISSKFPFIEYMTLRRFYQIRGQMHTYLEGDRNEYPDNRAWKVRRMFDLLRRAFMLITKAPSEFLSMDESMLNYSGSRNPIRVIIPNKPNSGFRV